MPATLASHATPTPQRSFLADAISPAHRVPWLSSHSLGKGRPPGLLKSCEPAACYRYSSFEKEGCQWVLFFRRPAQPFFGRESGAGRSTYKVDLQVITVGIQTVVNDADNSTLSCDLILPDACYVDVVSWL